MERENENNLEELRRRVNALFESAAGRVGPTHADLAAFIARLNVTAGALLRQRFPEECGAQQHESKRQRRESVVCSGSWERKWDTIAELERERGQSVYEEVSVELDAAGSSSLTVRQFNSHFWCSGCRLWDSAVALARYLYIHPALVRDQRVIELGCGVAPVPGLCAARMLASSVRLTEGEPNLMPSIRHNVARALFLEPSREDAAAEGCHGNCRVSVAALNWGAEPAVLAADHGQHDVLLGSDLIYSSGASEPLAAAASTLVCEGGRLLLTYPAGRHGVAEFRLTLESTGWVVQEQALERALLRGCANQGTEEEVAAHTFMLLDARRVA